MCYSAFCIEYEYKRISLINNIIIYNIFIEKSGSFGGGLGKKQMINRIKNRYNFFEIWRKADRIVKQEEQDEAFNKDFFKD